MTAKKKPDPDENKETEDAVNLADRKAKEAAEAEAHLINQKLHSGTSLVTHQMNTMFSGLITTAVFEAHTKLKTAFDDDGIPTETAMEDIQEAAGCLAQAAVFMGHLKDTFRPVDDHSGHAHIAFRVVPVEENEGFELINHRITLVDDGSHGTVVGYFAAENMYWVRLDDETTHYLERTEFHVTN